jgi:hypothetical protein
MSHINRIYVDSRDRVHATDTASDFTVRMGNSEGVTGATGLSLTEAIIPLTYNVIEEGVNDTLYCGIQTWGNGSDGGATSLGTLAQQNPFTVTIPPGSYTTDELLLVLKTETDAVHFAAHPTLDLLNTIWTYSTVVSKFTASSGALQYNFKEDAGDWFYDVFLVWDKALLAQEQPGVLWRKTMNYMLGLTELNFPAAAVPDQPINSYPWTSSEVHRIYGWDYIYLMLSNGLVRDAVTTAPNGVGSTVLAKIPVSSFTGEIQFFNRDSPIVAEVNQNNIDELHVRVMNPHFETINFNGGEISFTLSVHRDQRAPWSTV